MAEFGLFDWEFIVWLCAFGIITILFLFYFNRILSSILSALLNAYTWTFFGASLDIKAIQISPLGGRIFFKGVKYHGENETILVHDGFITWRYWYRRVRHADITLKSAYDRRTSSQSTDDSSAPQMDTEDVDQKESQNPKHPFRILIEVRGVEWFVYNRKPAYDSVLATLLNPSGNSPGKTDTSPSNSNEGLAEKIPRLRKRRSNDNDVRFDVDQDPEKEEDSKFVSGSSTSPDGTPTSPRRNSGDVTSSESQIPMFVKLLPIGFIASHAAMVMGNENTKSILVAKAESVEGMVEAKRCGPQDPYRQSFDFELKDTKVQFKQNHDYLEPQLQKGLRVKAEKGHDTQVEDESQHWWNLGRQKTQLIDAIKNLNPLHSSSKTSIAEPWSRKRDTVPHAQGIEPADRWLGLSRYLKDDEDGHLEQERWKAIEYARFEDILDTTKIVMSFYWDVPGPVPSDQETASPSDDINGDTPPSYGLEVEVHGGSINYGPWADRQRTNIQSVFFPAAHTTINSVKPLQPGQPRISTLFKIFINLQEEVTLRIHTREESKDWRWRDHLQKSKEPTTRPKSKSKKGGPPAVDPNIRPDGWFDLRVGSDSSVTYSMGMTPKDTGYTNSLQMDLKHTSMTSSVNHDLMWRCTGGSLSCNLPNPLTWNELRKWQFDITLNEFELFFIRDHAFLLTDLVNDWTTGPPGEFYTFVPFLYSLKLTLPNFKVYLNSNDSNIIDKPASLEDNTFIIISADNLIAEVGIPIREFRPLKNKVTFDVTASQGGLRFVSPTWVTQRTFIDNDVMGAFQSIVVKGSYNYCTSTSTTLTDTLLLDAYGNAVSLNMFGFLVRSFMTFKDNYFGEDMHFQTQDEFQRRVHTPKQNRTSGFQDRNEHKISNDLDVILTVSADESSVMVPSYLYSASESIKVDITFFSADLRFTNYYMDLQVDFSPLALTRGFVASDDDEKVPTDSSTQVFIDGVTVAGHRLFGLPPTEPTYVCNWDFHIGTVQGECSLDFVKNAIGAARSFAFSFKDVENALPKVNPLVLHDITFLRASVEPIKLWLHVDSAAFLINTEAITVTFDDWAGDRFSERLHLSIPKVAFACMDGQAASRNRVKSKQRSPTYAYLSSAIDVRMVESKADFRENSRLQQEHVALHDSRTHRTPWLLHDESPLAPYHVKARPPISPFPPMPEPLGRSHKSPSLNSSSRSYQSSLPGNKSNSSLLLTNANLRQSSRSRKLELNAQSGHGVSKDSAAAPPRSVPSQLVSENHYQYRESPAPKSVAFSSAYETPYFPLQHVEPDTGHVPTCAPDHDFDRGDQSLDSDTIVGEQDPSMAHTTLIVRLENGLSGLITPEALFHINSLVAKVQASTPNDILDQLHTGALSECIDESKTLAHLKCVQVRVTLPAMALRLQNQVESDSSGSGRWVYDVRLMHLVATAKQKPKPVASGQPQTSDLVGHLTLDKFKALASKMTDLAAEAQAKIELALDQTVIWLVRNQVMKGELQFNGLRLLNSNRKIEQLASLVNSTLSLADSLSNSFRETAVVQENRLRSLVYLLATTTPQTPGPTFLTSTPNALRTNSYNPRNEDTWKLLSRLRHVASNLSKEDQQNLVSSCTSTEMRYPNDARARVLAGFNKWRSWDLVDPGASTVMNITYGHQVRPSQVGLPGPILPVDLCLRSGLIQVVIDPGPKQNELSLRDIIVAASSRTSGSSNSSKVIRLKQDWAMEISVAKVGVDLNWGVCELSESILQQYLAAPSLTPAKLPENPVDANPITSSNWSLHVVSSIGQINTNFETINFKAFSTSTDLASSVVISKTHSNELFATVIATAAHLYSGIAGHHQAILSCDFSSPCLNGSLESRLESSMEQKLWKAGGLCQKMETDLKEDALGLLGVADLFIRDEMAYIRHIDEDIIGKLRKLPQRPRNVTSSPPAKHSFHISLLLQEYAVAVKLLSSLTYRIQGKTARSSLRTRGEANQYALDFDINPNRHSFTNSDVAQEQRVFEVMFPLVNGQLLPVKEEGGWNVSASLAVQKLDIHASEIHALFTTLSRREVSAFKDSVLRDLSLVKNNWKMVSWRTGDSSDSPNPTSPVENVRYNAKVFAEGLSVRASSSSSSKLSAQLWFDIGRLDSDISNIRSLNSVLTYPEISTTLDRIAIVLRKANGNHVQPCGDLSFAASFIGTSRLNEEGVLTRAFDFTTEELEVNMFPSTASSIVDILGYLQQRFKSFNLSDEINTFRARRSRAKSHATPRLSKTSDHAQEEDRPPSLFSSMYSLDMNYIQVCWHVEDSMMVSPGREVEDLVFSIANIDLATSRANSARLMLKDMQLQMVPHSKPKRARSMHSALLPEVVFNVAYLSTGKDRRLAFQAVGRTLDLRLTSQSLFPAADLQHSIAIATEELRKVVADWNAAFVREEQQNKALLGNKTLSSVLVDVDFAGAEVRIQSSKTIPTVASKLANVDLNSRSTAGNPNSDGSDRSLFMFAPGIAFKVEYIRIPEEHSLNAEIKVSASSNTLHPTVVPLILEVSESFKSIMGENKTSKVVDSPKPSPSKSVKQDPFASSNPAAILGDCRLNIGLRICKQGFTLTCQPIARVAATAQFEDIYVTVSTVQSSDKRRFFALSSVITSLECSVKHVYSRDKTGSFSLDSINLSLMNSRHVSDTEGLSAILKFSPMRIDVNAKQLHDFFLFREIWFPADVRDAMVSSPAKPSLESSQIFGVQRYQQMATASAFPWNATVSIESLDVRVDLGQSLGKTAFTITDFWISSRKSSDFQQSLCLGFGKVSVTSTGRLGGSIELRKFHTQTSITFPTDSANNTPLIEATLGFDDLRVKVAFEYQIFLIADLSSLQFLMYNVRDQNNKSDRLVATVEGDKIHMYITTQSTSQLVGVYQAMQRLVEDKRTAYEQSLKEVSKYLRRTSAANHMHASPSLQVDSPRREDENKTPLKLQTNVMVSLKAVRVGVYSTTFFDNQIFKLEALDANAKFGAALRGDQVESDLGMQLGQVRIALSNTNVKTEKRSLEDVSIDEVIKYSAGSRGGTILKVPKVVATMRTSQKLDSTHIDYIFKSSFEGKVEVGWNYSRISYIRGMWDKHSRTLAHRLGKPVTQSAVQITGGPQPKADGAMDETDDKLRGAEQEKITAVVNVPLSKYTYTAIEPPVIVTPQLRDMGDATPPLEWIGLHRDRLPNVTHQIIIVPLLEVAKEVEDAYSTILGSS